MSETKLSGAGEKVPPRQRRSVPAGAHSRAQERSGSTGGQLAKIIVLGIVGGLALWGVFPLISAHAWVALGVLIAVTVVIFYVYLSRRVVPLKYLVPGTLFLIAFQVLPVLLTVTTAFTNYGDAHRGSKQDAVVSIQTSSVKQVPGSPEYQLSVASTGDPATGPLVFLLTDATGKPFIGDTDGLRPLSPADVTISAGRITAANGYTLLNLGQASSRGDAITKLTVPTPDGAVRANGITRAFDGKASQHYDAGCDCVTDSTTGHVWKANAANGSFVDSDGQRLAQGWKVNVGFANMTRVLTDSRVSGHFLGTLLWNLAFALLSVLVTFVLGLACALALDSDKIRGRSIYRILLVLPYAMPSFAMLLVWSDLFNQDFGLVNRLLNLNVDWFGGVWTARFCVILIQLWLGYPYMFLVCTGALQAIPKEMAEAAQIDGASAWNRLRQVTLPLLLIALSPLLISSFAYNFNNFNAVRLTTDGGPFPANDSTVGATDLLVTYTYRLAFGGSGAQSGFAAAISIYIFAIVALISVVSFRRTRRLEEVYS